MQNSPKTKANKNFMFDLKLGRRLNDSFLD